MKAGFTLIELIISLAITAILGIALNAFLSQSMRTQAGLGRLIQEHTRAVIAFHQFERDIMGTCMPVQNVQKKQEAPKQPGQQEPPSKTEPIKPVEHVFYIQQSKENLKLFTIITSNPLPVYWSKQLGKPKANIARVVYTLVPDEFNKEAFILMRQEDENLNLKAYTAKGDAAIRPYELINGIKSIKFNFTVFKYPEPPPEQPQPEQQKPAPMQRNRVVEKRPTWDWPLEQKPEEKEKEESPFPHFVTITLELWDDFFEHTTEFIYTVPVMIDATTEKPKEEKKAETPSQPAQPTEQKKPEKIAHNNKIPHNNRKNLGQTQSPLFIYQGS